MAHRSALVIGGGIAGIQASLDMAQAGVEVFLLEREPSIGGRMAQLDKTFPTNDCAMCILSPKLVEAGGHPNIHLLTNAELLGLDGSAPQFRARIRKHPRYVDESKCTGCGVCTAKCPVKIPDPYNKGLGTTRCMHIPFPQAVPALPLIDRDSCIFFKRGKCRACEKVCQVGAVDFEQQAEDLALEVGAVVVAFGSQEFEARLKDEYGYGTFPNVVTSIELERMLSASGPSGGHVRRPSDGQEPKRIGFLQCVGSRDQQVGRDFCSAICCMQASKDAIILSEHIHGVETSIFGMDVRAFGKGFDRFVERGEQEFGVRMVRARISSVEVDPETEDILLQVPDEQGRLRTESFHLLVLSVGLCTSPQALQTLARLGLRADADGFLPTAPFRPVETARPGVFACGTITGPKDIPESVMEASGASSAALASLALLPPHFVKVEPPAERDIRGEPPRIGVFVCHCGINIASTVDVEAVATAAKALPRVVYADHRLFACSSDSQKGIAEAIHQHGLNRVVVAACTPRTHEPLFQKTLEESGLNRYLFEFVNIREHCSWVHQREPAAATRKAVELVRMGVAKAARLRPLARSRLEVWPEALVIGGGVAGMTAALDLAAQNFQVHLVERADVLGGNARRVRRSLEGGDVPELLGRLEAEVQSNPKLTVHLQREVREVTGYVGNFTTRLSGGEEIRHGVAIIATGAAEIETSEHLRGQDPRVLTQLELEERLEGNGCGLGRFGTLVMLQCVGSRDEGHPYCSRICCGTAVKNALRVVEKHPRARVCIIGRDVRTYGLRERAYREAREKGVVFIRHERDAGPVVARRGDSLVVRVRDEAVGDTVELRADWLVLSTGIEPREDSRELSQQFKVPLTPERFFLEAHVKLRPVDFATDGVFVCGLAHYPKDLGESVAQARAAASRAATLLTRGEIEAEGKVAGVLAARCSGCGACAAVCAYQAIELDPVERIARVNAAICKGCGTCAATCRVGAIDLDGFRDDQILASIEGLG